MFDTNQHARRVADTAFSRLKSGALDKIGIAELRDVTIERLDWSKFVEAYDRPATLFYLDPPYYDCEKDYGVGVFAKSDFTRMAEQLSAIEGAFILSLNDVPAVREIFAAFTVVSVELTYSINGPAPVTAREVLIMNDEAAVAVGRC